MSSLFVMLTSFWMEFLEYRTDLFCCLSLTEGTDVVINLIDDNVWEDEDELTGVLNEKVES